MFSVQPTCRTLHVDCAPNITHVTQATRGSLLTAVLLAVADYEKLIERLNHLELLAEAHRISAEMDRDPARVTSHEELRRQLAAKASQS